jgi:hypothetical protein
MSNQEYWNNVGKGLENAFNPNNWNLGRFGGGVSRHKLSKSIKLSKLSKSSRRRRGGKTRGSIKSCRRRDGGGGWGVGGLYYN